MLNLLIKRHQWIFFFFFVYFFPSYAISSTVAHSYDSLNRLTQTVITDGSKTTTITYQYDAAGNMTQTAVTVNSGSAATQGAKSALSNEPNELIETDEDETGNDLDLDDDND